MPGPGAGLNPPIGGRQPAEQAPPLLGIKTRPPWRSRGVIARPRLDTYLPAIHNHLLSVVVAPPGFGKTTAALSWADALAGAGGRVAWLSLGPEDDEPERFLNYLEAAIAPVCGTAADSRAAGALSATFSVPVETRLGWLMDEVGAQAGDVFLFLDDYHLVSHAQIHVAMSFLLRFAPKNLHVVMLSRENTALHVNPLRARDGVLDIPAQALLFDVEETDQLLNKGEFSHAISDQAPALHALTGGWIAALRAAVASMRNHGGADQYLRKLPATLRPISSLFGDLLEGLAPALVDFLERVSITERLCAGLAEVLAPGTKAQAMLEQLEQLQLFIDRQDDQGTWFVLHPLFRDFLQQQALKREDLHLAELHQRASRWFAAQLLWSQAIHHALAAGDVARALGWIESRAMALVGDGDILTLLSWERQLRTHLVASPIRLRLAFAWALCLAMASERALALLDGVELSLGALSSLAVRTKLQRECTALRAVLLAEKGDFEAASALANQYLCEPVAQPWLPNAILNVIANAHLQAARWEQLYVVPALARDPDDHRMPDRTSMVYRLSILGLAEYRQGHLEDAARYLEEGMALGAAIGERGKVLQALPAPTLALVRYEQGNIDEAKRINAQHFEINRRVGPLDGLSGCYRIAARVARMQGQLVSARTLLDDAERIATARGWSHARATLCMERIRCFLLDGRMAEARAGIERLEMLQASIAQPGLEYEDIHRHVRLVRAWRALVESPLTTPASDLEDLMHSARTTEKLLDELGVGTTLALAWLAQGRQADATNVFIGLCRRAMAAGAVRALLDQPVATEGLIRLALAQVQVHSTAPSAAPGSALTGFMQRLLSAATGVDGGGISSAAPELSTLSPREHRILLLIAQGLSNKEIARNLGVTAETVKSHLKKIYPKLGVQNRAQAASHVPVQHGASLSNE